jgi:hypothetical protein
MKTVVKYASGDEFPPAKATDNLTCYRCSEVIEPGEFRMDFASIVTSPKNNKSATLSWNTLCERCARKVIDVANKIRNDND